MKTRNPIRNGLARMAVALMLLCAAAFSSAQTTTFTLSMTDSGIDPETWDAVVNVKRTGPALSGTADLTLTFTDTAGYMSGNASGGSRMVNVTFPAGQAKHDFKIAETVAPAVNTKVIVDTLTVALSESSADYTASSSTITLEVHPVVSLTEPVHNVGSNFYYSISKAPVTSSVMGIKIVITDAANIGTSITVVGNTTQTYSGGTLTIDDYPSTAIGSARGTFGYANVPVAGTVVVFELQPGAYRYGRDADEVTIPRRWVVNLWPEVDITSITAADDVVTVTLSRPTGIQTVIPVVVELFNTQGANGGYVTDGVRGTATFGAGESTASVTFPRNRAATSPTGGTVTAYILEDDRHYSIGDSIVTSGPLVDSRFALSAPRSRIVGYAMSGFGRSLGWDTVDSVRGRAIADRAMSQGGGQGGGKRSMLEADSVKQYLAAELRAQSSPQAGGSGGLDRESLNAAAFGGNAAMNATESAVLRDSYGPRDGHGAVGHPGARADGGSGGPQWQNLRVWASAERGAMAFAPGKGLDFDGETRALRMGVEGNRGDYLMGVALTYFTGDLKFSDAQNKLDGNMKLEQRFLSPYAAVTLGGVRLWGTVGLGGGTLDYRDVRSGLAAAGSSDTNARLLAVGMEFDVARRGEMELVGRLEGMGAKLRADGTGSEAIDLYHSQEADVRGTRGELEAGWSFDSARVGGLVRPYLSAGFRWDEGEDLNGRALEYGGGLRVQTDDLSFDGAARSQILEGDGDFERDSLSLSLAYDSGNDGRGLSLKLSNRHGEVAGRSPFERSMSYAGRHLPQRMTTSVEMGYGVDLGHATLRPHASADLDGSAAGRLVTGLSLANGWGGLGQGFNLDLTHTLDVAPDPSRDDRHALELRANVRF